MPSGHLNGQPVKFALDARLVRMRTFSPMAPGEVPGAHVTQSTSTLPVARKRLSGEGEWVTPLYHKVLEPPIKVTPLRTS